MDKFVLFALSWINMGTFFWVLQLSLSRTPHVSQSEPLVLRS
jgi:hypothetical protein